LELAYFLFESAILEVGYLYAEFFGLRRQK
jgi:hypothetical protein